jgi:hypothetical protein
MRKFTDILIPLCLILVTVSSALSLAQPGDGAVYLYRYQNDDGVTVINSGIPAEFIHGGYEILNSNGTVFKEVPRSLTEEERAARSSEDKAKRIESEETERLLKWDESLLLRYSSIEDIEAARDRALSELRIRISILRSNVRSLRLQVESNQSRAANAERRGGTVPVELVAAIDILNNEIGDTERSIEERVQETEVVEQGFQRDMDRFALLLDKVELRRRFSRVPD